MRNAYCVNQFKFDREEALVLDAMRKFIAPVERSEDHLFKQQLTDIAIAPIPDSFMKEVTIEGEK